MVVHSDGLPVPQRYWSMLAIALGITMAVLDSAVANVALPAMARDLGASPAASVWIINGYQLAIVITLLPLAALGESLGYRRVYLAGLVLFTAGSLACSFSQSLTALVAARAAQGLGAAGIMSVNGALVRFTYPHALLGRGVGLNALVVSVAAAIGPTIASAILAVGPWEWLFAVNVPIGAVNLIIAARALPYSNPSNARFDWKSAALNAMVLGFFFIGAEAYSSGEEGPFNAAVLLTCAAAASVVLYRREREARAPVIPIDLLRIPVFGRSVLTSICSFAAYMLAFIALPFFFETALHRDQVQTGLLMTPWPVALGLAASVSGRLSDKIPSAILGAAGLAAMALGLIFLAFLPGDATVIRIAAPMALCGLGFGFFQAPNNRTLLSSAPKSRAGAAGGMLAIARLLGFTLGATFSGLIFRYIGQNAETAALLLGTLLAVCASAISLSRLKEQRPKASAVSAE